MPTYPYHCRNCGHEFEELQSFTEPELIRCPRCGTDSLVRVFGGGGALIFKGSGFYLTDYKKGNALPATTQKPKEKTGEKKETPGASPSESSGKKPKE